MATPSKIQKDMDIFMYVYIYIHIYMHHVTYRVTYATLSAGAQPLVCSKSQRNEAFDGEWQNGMKGSIFDQAEW